MTVTKTEAGLVIQWPELSNTVWERARYGEKPHATPETVRESERVGSIVDRAFNARYYRSIASAERIKSYWNVNMETRTSSILKQFP